jgi:hypothetical protein
LFSFQGKEQENLEITSNPETNDIVQLSKNKNHKHIKQARKYSLSGKTQQQSLIISNNSFYLPSSRVTVNPLLETVSGLLDEEALLEGHRLKTNAGCLGSGRVGVSLPSMKSMLDTVGRSPGSSCTHNSPTFAHFTN